MRALEAIREHGAGVLLAAKRDRSARDTVVAAVVGRMAERNGAAVRTADGVGRGDTPEDKLLRTMIDAFAEYERVGASGRQVAEQPRIQAEGLHVPTWQEHGRWHVRAGIGADDPAQPDLSG